MGIQNRSPAFHVRIWHMDLPIETSRTEERLVQIFRPVGRGDHYDALAAFEAVHRREQGIDCLLMLAVRVELAILADAINFIDEDDRGFVFGRLAEELAD